MICNRRDNIEPSSIMIAKQMASRRDCNPAWNLDHIRPDYRSTVFPASSAGVLRDDISHIDQTAVASLRSSATANPRLSHFIQTALAVVGQQTSGDFRQLLSSSNEQERCDDSGD
eukprot:CAMPEP_0176015740 /NCGR_PEP_ID=MMETSP0120_2-20121206/7493_1 /TAXON_ID=160619 /ORGANISM="Kryptoperidinium foliaceum, Strain CCMP 1326" /LENGTH=114 /DNA_ID=CAMNT_0017348719 /DNA_START=89 /DNA_END=433 /DNA_ORIENTATION=-